MSPDIHSFAIGFDPRDRARLHTLWDEVIDSNQWSHGAFNQRFEAAWEAWNGAPAVATGSWSGAAVAALEFAGVRGEAVLCPSNTFMATPLAIIAAGGRPVFVDCNREDLCVSFADFERKVAEHRPKAAVLVHIGGHIAFDTPQIAELCRSEGIFLFEDCAHAHGASWNGAKPGTFGDAGAYSFYATKTVSTGEGGVLVSENPELIEFARRYRDYGKPEYDVNGLNFRMSEFTAALALVQTERMEEIVRWKNDVAREVLDPAHPGRLQLPEGMVSGLYKYIVFDPIEKSSGKVYDQPCHRIMGTGDDLPNADWVAEHHWCVPFYYRPEVAVAQEALA
ncbi:MAG: DegT/DnrJ/EryC1/StrS aminotransferase [Solirubrobacteraceae bacterium]|nr:DegT/DnrJ/EryC1/StrS aminotransferase [Solirubrobacteraceae bacterium]